MPAGTLSVQVCATLHVGETPHCRVASHPALQALTLRCTAIRTWCIFPDLWVCDQPIRSAMTAPRRSHKL